MYELRVQISRQHPRKPDTRPLDIMVIGDSHADPDVPNTRYEWLGKLSRSTRPDVIVDMGDWADMASLSHFDKGKRGAEKRRYEKDVNAAIDARERFNRYALPKKGKKPRLISLLGNHEERINKATDDNPNMDGWLSTDDLKTEDLGWEQYDFMVPAIVGGIAFVHYAPSGVKTKPIGGMNHASNLIRLGLMSTVVGHAHTFDYSERTRLDGKKLMGLSAGCAFEHFMPWAGPANAMYWRGVVMLRDVEDGFGSVEQIPWAKIKREYA